MARNIPENQSSNSVLVSIIICTFNRTQFLSECLTSLVGQTYQNIEVIIINDGSKGKVKRTLHDISQHFSSSLKIRLFHVEENKGLASCQNYGLSLAEGAFVVFLDDDDTVASSFVTKMASELMASPEKAAVMCQGQVMKQSNRDRHYYKKKYAVQFANRNAQMIENDISKFCLIYAPLVNAFMYRREHIMSVSIPVSLSKIGNDTYRWLMMDHKKQKIKLFPEVLAYHRTHESNVSRDVCLSTLRASFYEEIAHLGNSSHIQYLIDKGRIGSRYRNKESSFVDYVLHASKRPFLLISILFYQSSVVFLSWERMFYDMIKRRSYKLAKVS